MRSAIKLKIKKTVSYLEVLPHVLPPNRGSRGYPMRSVQVRTEWFGTIITTAVTVLQTVTSVRFLNTQTITLTVHISVYRMKRRLAAVAATVVAIRTRDFGRETLTLRVQKRTVSAGFTPFTGRQNQFRIRKIRNHLLHVGRYDVQRLVAPV
jgi:hypothetical protein